MTMTKNEIQFDPGLVEAEENLLVDYQFLLQERMTKKGLSHAELAERAGISNARLSQIMSDEANPTVKTFAALFYALGERVCVSSMPLDELHEPPVAQEASQEVEWEWAKPVRIAKPISEEMMALVKDSAKVFDERDLVSNDNYSPPGTRIAYFDSEVATAFALETEPELEAA
jgi:transcriptional regulator with XRE-family HTH domain